MSTKSINECNKEALFFHPIRTDVSYKCRIRFKQFTKTGPRCVQKMICRSRWWSTVAFRLVSEISRELIKSKNHWWNFDASLRKTRHFSLFVREKQENDNISIELPSSFQITEGTFFRKYVSQFWNIAQRTELLIPSRPQPPYMHGDTHPWGSSFISKTPSLSLSYRIQCKNSFEMLLIRKQLLITYVEFCVGLSAWISNWSTMYISASIFENYDGRRKNRLYT